MNESEYATGVATLKHSIPLNLVCIRQRTKIEKVLSCIILKSGIRAQKSKAVSMSRSMGPMGPIEGDILTAFPASTTHDSACIQTFRICLDKSPELAF